MNKILVAIIALIVAATAAVLGGDGAPAWLARLSPSIAALIGPAKRTDVVFVSGNIEAHESVLGFKTVQSRIVELPFDEGRWVKAGTVLARVDDSDYRQQVAIADAALDVERRAAATARGNLDAAQGTLVGDQADLAQKKLDFGRAHELWLHGDAPTALRRDEALAAAAQTNVDLAEANVRSAEENLRMARIVLGYATLEAPFDGVIAVRQAELGEIAPPGMPIVTLADLDHVWLRAYINEPDIGKVRLGEEVSVTTDTYPDKVYKGRISFVASEAEFTPKTVDTHAERISLVYRIRIDIDNPTHELVPGMPADATIPALPHGS
jgi:HlyD family secretion protein